MTATETRTVTTDQLRAVFLGGLAHGLQLSLINQGHTHATAFPLAAGATASIADNPLYRIEADGLIDKLLEGPRVPWDGKGATP